MHDNNIKHNVNMIQIIKEEWLIAKTYIYEVVLRDGLVNLDWNDFELFAKGHRPIVAIKNEDNLSVAELAEKAMSEVKKYCAEKIYGIIIFVSYKEGEEIMMNELLRLIDGMGKIADESVKIMYGVSKNDDMECKRSICIYAFE